MYRNGMQFRLKYFQLIIKKWKWKEPTALTYIQKSRVIMWKNRMCVMDGKLYSYIVAIHNHKLKKVSS